MPYIKRVDIFTNGLVAVFDNNGEQLTNFQGQWSDKGFQILEASEIETEFYITKWKPRQSIQVTDEELRAMFALQYPEPQSTGR